MHLWEVLFSPVKYILPSDHLSTLQCVCLGNITGVIMKDNVLFLNKEIRFGECSGGVCIF